MHVVSELTFADGSAVHLSPEQWVRGNGVCTEESGRWEGIAGAYLGRAGTYLEVQNRLQRTLTLREP